MAIVFATKNGNWSDVTVWNTGALPLPDDDVYADGKTVTIDQDVTVLSIRNDQRSGGTDGGSFIPNDGVTINANLIRSIVTLVNFSTSGILNINGNSSTASQTINSFCVDNTGSGIINYNGNLFIFSQNNRSLLRNGATGTLNFTGTIDMSATAGNSIGITNLGTLNYYGSFSDPLFNTSNTSHIGISNGVSAKTNFFGILKSTSGSATIGILNSGYLFFEGVIEGVYVQNSRPAIQDSGTSAINIIKGLINCSPYGDFPLSVKRMNYVPAQNTFITFADNSTNGQLPPAAPPPTTFTLYSADVVLDSPEPTDVRDGIEYAEGILTGTLIVPTPDNVRKNIPVDNTVGTAELTGPDIADSILQALNDSTLPLAVRLKNVATVQSTGDQITSI